MVCVALSKILRTLRTCVSDCAHEKEVTQCTDGQTVFILHYTARLIRVVEGGVRRRRMPTRLRATERLALGDAGAIRHDHRVFTFCARETLSLRLV